MVPLGEARWLNNRESAPQIDKTAGMPASELLDTCNRQITEVIPKYVVYSGEEMLEKLVEYAKLRYGTTFSRGVDIFPVLDVLEILEVLVFAFLVAFGRRHFSYMCAVTVSDFRES